jgi:sulfite exporter TauE/SafE
MSDPGVISLTAAFVAGVAGSTHCFAMCGGMAGALGMRARATAAGPASAFANASTFQAGRIGSYAAIGALFGLAGAALESMFDLMRIGVVLRVASGALLILIALRILVRWNALVVLERLGARFWSKVQPYAQRAACGEGRGRALLLGALWGWLPCGLVYSMLAFAATSGDATSGAAIMAAFGAGTLPSMLTASLLASQVQRLLARRWPRAVSGVLLLLFGVWMTLAPLLQTSAAHHAH